jgi:hypothetical protein
VIISAQYFHVIYVRISLVIEKRQDEQYTEIKMNLKKATILLIIGNSYTLLIKFGKVEDYSKIIAE